MASDISKTTELDSMTKNDTVSEDAYSSSMSTQPIIQTSLSNDSRFVVQKQGKPQHKLLLFLHFALKILVFFCYIFSGVMGMGFKTTFVFLLLLLSVDFWIVKNLCGRLLAGLRWWSVVDSQGQMKWQFEQWSSEERNIAPPFQINLFWFGLFAQQTIWSILFLSSLFSLHLGWLVFTIIACFLNGSNLIGYIRCRLQSREDSPGIFSRLRDTVTNLFKIPGGRYTKGQRVSSGDF